MNSGQSTECKKCAIGHRLEDGKCVLCDELLTCNTCTDEVCIDCADGFYLDDGNVKRALIICIIVLAACRAQNVSFVTQISLVLIKLDNATSAKTDGPRHLRNL